MHPCPLEPAPSGGHPGLAEPGARWRALPLSLPISCAVAPPADAGSLFQSVYAADFGGGTVSQITSSGLLLDGLLQGASGWFAPGVNGDGLLAYVLFQYQPGHEGQDPQATVPGEPAPVPEPASLALAALAAAR